MGVCDNELPITSHPLSQKTSLLLNMVVSLVLDW